MHLSPITGSDTELAAFYWSPACYFHTILNTLINCSQFHIWLELNLRSSRSSAAERILETAQNKLMQRAPDPQACMNSLCICWVYAASSQGFPCTYGISNSCVSEDILKMNNHATVSTRLTPTVLLSRTYAKKHAVTPGVHILLHAVVLTSAIGEFVQ